VPELAAVASPLKLVTVSVTVLAAPLALAISVSPRPFGAQQCARRTNLPGKPSCECRAMGRP
jgi:hypothetical protein